MKPVDLDFLIAAAGKTPIQMVLTKCDLVKRTRLAQLIPEAEGSLKGMRREVRLEKTAAISSKPGVGWGRRGGGGGVRWLQGVLGSVASPV